MVAAIDRWAAAYGVDPKLARALAWMESGFQQDVVSSAGAIGVMQLLPETWEFVDTVLLGEATPRTYEGNVRAGVRFLRWQLDEFDGNVRLALAGYYQGARAVRERGLFDDTKQYVSVILAALRLGLSLLERRRSGDLEPLAATATADARDVTAEEPFGHLGVVELELPQEAPPLQTAYGFLRQAHAIRDPAGVGDLHDPPRARRRRSRNRTGDSCARRLRLRIRIALRTLSCESGWSASRASWAWRSCTSMRRVSLSG